MDMFKKFLKFALVIEHFNSAEYEDVADQKEMQIIKGGSK